MTKWELINNKRSHSHLSYSYSCLIPISLRNLAPIPMGILREGWESRISHSNAHLYTCNAHFLNRSQRNSEKHGQLQCDYIYIVRQ